MSECVDIQSPLGAVEHPCKTPTKGFAPGHNWGPCPQTSIRVRAPLTIFTPELLCELVNPSVVPIKTRMTRRHHKKVEGYAVSHRKSYSRRHCRLWGKTPSPTYGHYRVLHSNRLDRSIRVDVVVGVEVGGNVLLRNAFLNRVRVLYLQLPRFITEVTVQTTGVRNSSAAGA